MSSEARGGSSDPLPVARDIEQRKPATARARKSGLIRPIRSRFEPCGLGQLQALRYGTLPIVRAVGGLDDTVVEWDDRTATGNGFKFEDYTARALVIAVLCAIATT